MNLAFMTRALVCSIGTHRTQQRQSVYSENLPRFALDNMQSYLDKFSFRFSRRSLPAVSPSALLSLLLFLFRPIQWITIYLYTAKDQNLKPL